MQISFRIFATKKDLINIFLSLQHDFEIYYVPTYSDKQDIQIKDILSIPNFGINTSGKKIGNNQYLIFYQRSICHWRTIKVKDIIKEKYSALIDENIENIIIDVGGLYNDSIVFPTEISTIHYENELSKKLFNDLKRVVRKNTSVTKSGYIICHNAYKQRNQYRFCTINAQSPKEYDLKVE